MKCAPADAIICDGMPFGFAAGSMQRTGDFYQWVPYAGQTVAAADSDLALESDEPSTVSLDAIIPGYGRLRGF